VEPIFVDLILVEPPASEEIRHLKSQIGEKGLNVAFACNMDIACQLFTEYGRGMRAGEDKSAEELKRWKTYEAERCSLIGDLREEIERLKINVEAMTAYSNGNKVFQEWMDEQPRLKAKITELEAVNDQLKEALECECQHRDAYRQERDEMIEPAIYTCDCKKEQVCDVCQIIVPLQNQLTAANEEIEELKETLIHTHDLFVGANEEIARLKKTNMYLGNNNCTLMDKITELEAEVSRLREDYINACLCVAQMHEAAVGEVTGPKRGVVEDVLEVRLFNNKLKQELSELEAENAELKEEIRELRSRYLGIDKTCALINEAIHTTATRCAEIATTDDEAVKYIADEIRREFKLYDLEK
jgi:hypothetical protein